MPSPGLKLDLSEASLSPSPEASNSTQLTPRAEADLKIAQSNKLANQRPGPPTRSNASAAPVSTPTTTVTASNLAAAIARSRNHRSGTVVASSTPGLPGAASEAPSSDDDEGGYEGGTEKERFDEDSDDPRSPAGKASHAMHARDQTLMGPSRDSSVEATPRPPSSNASTAKLNGISSSTTNTKTYPPGSSDSLHADYYNHSRYSSADSTFVPPHFSRTASTARSDFASSRPFPTPGLREHPALPRSASSARSSSHASARPEPEAFDFKSVEEKRLEQDGRKEMHWKRWGPYLSERQWASPFSYHL